MYFNLPSVFSHNVPSPPLDQYDLAERGESLLNQNEEQDIFVDAEDDVFYEAVDNCCSQDNSCMPSYATADSALSSLMSRSVKKEPFIPQSYNYKDFEANQLQAINQNSIYETLSVYRSLLIDINSKDSERNKGLVTNLKTLSACRFFPQDIKLSEEENSISSRDDRLIEEPIDKSSLVGQIAQAMSTLCGKEFLLVRASNPSKSKKLITKRQNAIRSLVHNEELRSKLQESFKIYASNEKQYCSRLAPNATKLPGRIESSLKFALCTIPESSGKWINQLIRENSTLVTINSTIKTSMDGFQAALLPLMTASLGVYAFAQIVPDVFSAETTGTINALASRYIGQAGIAFSAIQSVGGRTTNFVASALAAGISYLKIDDTVGYFRAEWNVKNCLQKKMVFVSKCIRSMEEVYTLVKETPAFQKNLEHFDKLKNLFESENPKVRKMLDAIHSSTLDKEKSFFCLGPVLVGWNLLLDKEVRNLVLESEMALGEVEANLALANTVVNSTNDRPFSLPEIVGGDEAVFEAIDAHFPPISSHAVEGQKKSGSIHLNHTTVITAENGAGKTTFSLAWINLILSVQSLGIAPCAKGTKVSIYDSILNSKVASDSNGLSTHESQEKFKNDLLTRLNKHRKEKVFVVLDEIFGGTDDAKGTRKLIEFVNDLSREHPDRFKAIFITHNIPFAKDTTYSADKYTTHKKITPEKPNGIPSGELVDGVYDFSK